MTIALNNSIAAMTPELIEWRRDFHRNPELLYDLPRTSRIVAERLRALGFDQVVEGVAKTGVLGVLHGAMGPASAKEKRALFRADMDALPIQEASGADHASVSPGRMHACGHDGHTTMLLGAARRLAETRPFDGTLIFCFQPAEEGGAGAQAMIDEGMLERFPVKGAYAVHNWPGLPVGEFAVVRGPAMASAEAFNITVEGTGGHAAMPQRVRDPIVAASHIVAAIQTIVSRVVDPLDNAVVSVTSFHGGEAFNVIPDKVEMKGTVRTFSVAVSKSIEVELKRICERTAEAFGTNARLHRPPKLPYPATVNHPAETELALDAMRAVAGFDRVRDDMRPVMGSEDFAFLLRKVPGAYIFIGNGDTAGLHNPKYDFNDEAIPYGVAYWTELARRVLPA
ncbi:MAG: amidohydrolase [Hyphomicrobiales bacterium]|nr:amidohydrolase [Hyphomicrobiales bacterium]MBV8441476.1 amidohydrolase [Hyphomicrobiales bacterium]